MKEFSLLFCSIALAFCADERTTTNGYPERLPVTPGFELIDLTVFSVPSDARIEVSGNPAGHTPGLVRLRPGEYRLTVMLPGFEPWEQRIKIQVGQPKQINAELLPKTKAAAGPKSTQDRFSVQIPSAPGATSSAPSKPPEAQPSAGHEIKYNVTGAGMALVTYRNELGNVEQASVVLPWSLKFSAASGKLLMLSAQKQNSAAQKDPNCTETSGSSDCPSEDSASAASRGPIESAIYVDGIALHKIESAEAGLASVGGVVP